MTKGSRDNYKRRKMQEPGVVARRPPVASEGRVPMGRVPMGRTPRTVATSMPLVRTGGRAPTARPGVARRDMDRARFLEVGRVRITETRDQGMEVPVPGRMPTLPAGPRKGRAG